MNTQAAIEFHEATAECWRAKGKGLFADAHEARAIALLNGAGLTDYERTGDELGVMHEVAKGTT